MAAPTVGFTIIKKFPYRGDSNEEFSNHYWLTGATPADNAAWRTLFDLLVTEEKKALSSIVSVIGGYGYNSVSDGATAVWSVDLTVTPNTPVPGTMSTAAMSRYAGDSAYWIRWGLDRFARGKRIYLRKYFHPAWTDGVAFDTVGTPIQTACLAFATKMDDGSFAGGRKICDKQGNVPIGHAVGNWVTTRTLKRRGKRPPT